MKQLVILLLLLGFFSNITASNKDTVYIATANDFIKSIESNRVILLTNHIKLSNEEFIIENINNLEIIGSSKNAVKITTSNSGNTVIILKKSNHITFTNLSIGHWPDIGYCMGNVLDIEESDAIALYNCDVFGSGVLGLNLHYSTVWCYNTIIRDCSENIININEDHSSLIFNDCTFYLNQNNTVEYNYPQFINCAFYDANNKLIIKEYNGFYPNKPLRIQAKLETNSPVWRTDPNENGSFEGACTSPTKIEVSSYLKSINNSYKAVNMSDIQLDTQDATKNNAWVEGVKGHCRGEKITFTITSVYPKDGGEYWPLSSDFVIINGYTKNKSIWKSNGRVKQFKVSRNKKLVAYVNLLDSPNVQSFSLDEIIFKNHLTINETLEFEITKVYKGEKYKDTAITFFSIRCSP